MRAVRLRVLWGGLAMTARQGHRRLRNDGHPRDCRLCAALLALARSAADNERKHLDQRPRPVDDIGRESAA
jgi:hypothetical protein